MVSIRIVATEIRAQTDNSGSLRNKLWLTWNEDWAKEEYHKNKNWNIQCKIEFWSISDNNEFDFKSRHFIASNSIIEITYPDFQISQSDKFKIENQSESENFEKIWKSA